jgi:hypothetical protein
MQASYFNTSIDMQNKVMSTEKSIKLFQDRLLELSHHLDLPELRSNEFNVCSLAINNDHWIHISFSVEEMEVHWTSAMASGAYKNTKSLFSTLLAVNLDWQLTQGGFFAFDEVTEVVFYRFHEPLSNLHTQRFLEVTERFMERSYFWKQHLQRTIDSLPTMCNEDFAPNTKPENISLHSH